MLETTRRKDQLFLAAAIALLLFVSLLSGYVAVGAAVLLFAIGLVLYPEMRRTAITAGLVAAAVALVLVALRMLL